MLISTLKKMIYLRKRGLIAALLISIGLLGCNALNRLIFALPNAISVNQLQQTAQGTIIYIRGQVKDKAPFLGKGAYQLQDDTGKVWVVTNETLPQSGEEVIIKGQIEYQSIPVSGQELGEFYVLELEKLTSLPQQAEPAPITPESSSPTPLEVTPQPEAVPSPQPSPSSVYDDLFFPHKQNDK